MCSKKEKEMPQNIFQFGSRSHIIFHSKGPNKPERNSRSASSKSNRVPLYVEFHLVESVLFSITGLVWIFRDFGSVREI
jgi:hypothetical protein